ncbi:MAG: hypothetical protein B7C54_02505 [Acidimicrobiales bacterium mtb01]|nr:MAG: hypothetical protein B7C54_02505 [Acidimicrobiales bacterium mtb01]
MIVLFVLSWLFAGCGTVRSHSANELAKSLLAADDLPGEWKVDFGPDDGGLDPSGVVSDEQRELLPSVDFCEQASREAKSATDDLRWEAFRQFNQDVDDPIDPPFDREGRIVFVQEFLMSGLSSRLSLLLDRLREGFIACLGDIPAGEEGPGTAVQVPLGDVGDEGVAVLYRIQEAGGGGMWNVYSAIVRKDSVLVGLTLADVYLGDLEPTVDESMLREILETALAKLP